jgi:hypothetical protein
MLKLLILVPVVLFGAMLVYEQQLLLLLVLEMDSEVSEERPRSAPGSDNR